MNRTLFCIQVLVFMAFFINSVNCVKEDDVEAAQKAQLENAKALQKSGDVEPASIKTTAGHLVEETVIHASQGRLQYHPLFGMPRLPC